ncbi:MAG: hypothetical protein H6651_00080 [Ardenticatenales bacterium]|nr:hypothetical protein [Ardenticatenales bacterium]
MAGRSRRTGRFLLAFLAALLFLLPLYRVRWSPHSVSSWPATQRPAGVVASSGPLGELLTVFTLVPMGRYIGNSLLVVAAAIPITLVTASWAGWRWPNSAGTPGAVT